MFDFDLMCGSAEMTNVTNTYILKAPAYHSYCLLYCPGFYVLHILAEMVNNKNTSLSNLSHDEASYFAV